MANRFYVAGSGTTWNGTDASGVKWATTSGGTPAVGLVPTAADDVFFDANSTSGTVNWASGAVARSINCTGFTGTISHASGLTISIGDGTAGASSVALKLVAGMTYNIADVTSAFNFVSTSATQQTVASGGKTLGNLTFNASSNGSWKFNDDTTCNIVTLTKGTLNTNGKTITADSFAISNSNVRTLTLGASAINLTAASTNAWNASTTTNLTYNANTSVITINAGNFIGGLLTYNTVIFTASATLTSPGTMANLKFLPTAGAAIIMGGNVTVTTSLIATGVDANVNRLKLYTVIAGSNLTITAAAVTLTNVDFLDLIGAGAAAPFTGTSLGDLGGNTSITTTAPTTRYWVGGTGNWGDTSHWSTSSGGSGGASMPLSQGNAIFDSNSFSANGQTVTFNLVNQHISSLDASLATNHTHTFSSATSISFYCSTVKLSNQTTFSVAGLMIGCRSNLSFTQNGAICTTGITLAMVAGTLQPQDDFVTTAGMVIVHGTFDTNGNNVTLASLQDLGSGNKTLTLSSGKTLTLTGTGTIFSFYLTSSILNTNGMNVAITDTSITAKTFDFGSILTWGDVSITGGGSGSVTLQLDSILTTLGVLTIGAPKTVIVTGGTTLFVSGFIATGSQGNLINLQTTSGTINVQNSGGIVTCDWLSLQNWSVSSTSGLSWYAGIHSTDASGNSGWKFIMQRHGFINHQNPGIA